jgi:antitoxin component of MazEF toxin-antitoxin module
MTKIIASTNGADEITIDAALLQRAQLNSGDDVSVELHPGGGLTITPCQVDAVTAADAAATARRLIAKNDELFRRLSQ